MVRAACELSILHMWQANKGAIIALLAGLAVLGGVHWYVAQQDFMLAQRVLSTGLCILLFTVALVNWLSARKKK